MITRAEKAMEQVSALHLATGRVYERRVTQILASEQN